MWWMLEVGPIMHVAQQKTGKRPVSHVLVSTSKCMQDGESVISVHHGRPGALKKEALSLNSRSAGVGKWWHKGPENVKGSQKEQALWKIVHALEKLVGEQSGIQEELVRIWESSERMEDVLQDLVDQTKASWMQWNDLCRVNIPMDLGNGKTGRVRRSGECAEAQEEIGDWSRERSQKRICK